MSEYTPKTDKLWDDGFPAALKMSPINRCVFFFELLEKMRDHARAMEEDSFKWKCAAEAWELASVTAKSDKPPEVNVGTLTTINQSPSGRTGEQETMKIKAYHNFSDVYGNSYSFQNYESFAYWWYSTPRRRMTLALEPSTFKKLERAATQSKEARAAA